MLVRRRQALEVLSISALDIFASALGVFVLMAILLFPYYLKQPSIEREQAGAVAELTAAGDALTDATRRLDDALEQKADADATLAQARERLQTAEAELARAKAQQPQAAGAPPEPRDAPSQMPVALSIGDLDLVFVMDTTGSMRDELRDLQASAVGVIRVLHRLSSSLRIGFVAFKDHGDEYLTLVHPLLPMDAANVDRLVAFVRSLSAGGGGDDPEPVDVALEEAIRLPWRADAQGRIVVIGDAPAHAHNLRRPAELARHFHHSAPGPDAPRSVSTIFTGNDPATARFFEGIAEAGGGDFSIHQGQMIESVLLSLLPERTRQAAR
jgi:hypothetical protein